MSIPYDLIKERYQKYFSKLEPVSYLKTGIEYTDSTYTRIPPE